MSESIPVEETAQWISRNGFTKVALQFPDHLLPVSVKTADALRNRLSELRLAPKLFLLGDTSYGSCCVDEVAAEHACADAVVHYGETCLSRTSKLPVFYALGEEKIEAETCADHIAENLRPLLLDNNESSIILIAELTYQYMLSTISKHLKGILVGHKVLCTKVRTSFDPRHCTTNNNLDADEETQMKIMGRTLEGSVEMNDNTIIVWVGGETKTLSNLILTRPKQRIFSIDPQVQYRWRSEDATSNRALMKRFYMIQRAKDADAFGILMGTLGVASYMSVLEAVKRLLRENGRKFYVFALGKLNPAKLGNFPEIDCFINIACPENTLVDSKEFYSPIITPWELLCSIHEDRWIEKNYSLGFDDLLADPKWNNGLVFSERETEKVPHFSMLNGGKLKSNFSVSPNAEDDEEENISEDDENVAIEDEEEVTDKGKVVARRNANGAQIVKSVRTMFSALALENREFRGLEQQIGETAVEDATEGLRGIARSYR